MELMKEKAKVVDRVPEFAHILREYDEELKVRGNICFFVDDAE